MNLRTLSLPVSSKAFFLCGLLSLVAIALIVILAEKAPFYDEAYYLNHVGYIHEYGLSKKFLEEFPGHAGPLFGFVHYCLEPITGLATPQTRLVNVLLAGLVGWLLWKIGHRQKSPEPLAFAIMIFSIPPFWVVAGLALTELPSMAALCGALYLWAWDDEELSTSKLVLTAIAGFFLGMAIVGRQGLLVVLIWPTLLACLNKQFRIKSLAFLGSASILPAIVFGVWGGTKSPLVQGNDLILTGGKGMPLAPEHFFFSFGYALVVLAFLCPKILRLVRWEVYAVCIIGALIGSYLLLGGEGILPGRSLYEKFVPPELLEPMGLAAGLLLAVLATWAGWVFLRTAVHFARERNPKLGLCIAVGAILATPIVVSHTFSSRYVVVALPLMIPLFSSCFTANRAALLRLIFGGMLGAAMLSSWLYSDQSLPNHANSIESFYPELWGEGGKDLEWGNDDWRAALEKHRNEN